MSSPPQKQVVNQRLPPLSCTSAAVRPENVSQDEDRSEPPVSAEDAINDGTDLRSIFLEGPFRNSSHLNLQERSDFDVNLLKQNNVDPNVFLKDLNSINPGIIHQFLKSNPKVIDNYISQHVTKEELELWLDTKTVERYQESMTSLEGPPPTAKWKNISSLEQQNFMASFVAKTHASNGDIRSGVLDQIVDSCASAVKATGRNLYLTEDDAKKIWLYVSDAKKPANMIAVKEGTTLASYVASTKETVVTSHINDDQRFPEGLGINTEMQVTSVLCQPVLQPSGELIGVIELTRSGDVPEFTDKDVQIANGFLCWGGIVLHYAEMYHTMYKERKLNEFLLNVTKSIFQDIVSMDTVIMKILNFVQTLVDADRTSLFLVDNHTDELYARIFDIGTGLETKMANEIRFPRSKGVAGHVATTGETLNIVNAYDDPRFNKDVDAQTGYKTDTLLCMPIFIRGNIIGVVQMVNKKQGVFTKIDEKAFQAFAVYCGLALHHAKLYDKIRRSEQKHKIALDVLSYHSRCSDSEISEIKNVKLRYTKESMLDFDLNVMDLESTEMAHFAIQFFNDIFSLDNRFDVEQLTKFVLTVRKNYRCVPYHNWTHAFTVAHSMYCVIRHSKEAISGLDAIALYVACLCHDLDHRGRNNDWMRNESTLLASVYSTSTLEHHHFNQTVTILQHDGHNIFSHLSSSEYKNVLGVIRDCILSTDLASFFSNKAKLDIIVKNDEFDWKNETHRKMVHGLAMTSCDLSACAKPWKIQYETVKVIFKEFYAQGDEEKAHGRKPVPMMDRNTADKLPNHQVGFLVGICIPAFTLLCDLINGADPLLHGAKNNLSVWSDMVKKQGKKKSIAAGSETDDTSENSENNAIVNVATTANNIPDTTTSTTSATIHTAITTSTPTPNITTTTNNE